MNRTSLCAGDVVAISTGHRRQERPGRHHPTRRRSYAEAGSSESTNGRSSYRRNHNCARHGMELDVGTTFKRLHRDMEPIYQSVWKGPRRCLTSCSSSPATATSTRRSG